jgi:carboxymethylenebutenolidase
MTTRIKAAAVAVGGAAIAALAMNQMPRASAAAADEPTVQVMSATEHLAHMAAAGNIHAGHAMDEIRWAASARQAAAANAALPPDDMSAADRLAKSPRKGEFVTITVGGTPMRTWVVRPQGNARAPVVVVIQEIFGLSDWIRGVADQLAADGFIAVAPDLLAGRGPNGGDSTSIANQQEMMKTTLSLAPTDVVARLKAAREYGLKLPQSNGKSATVGFCFGGNQSFLMAVEEPSLNAAVVYYGTAPAAPAAAGAAPAAAPPAGGGRGGAPAPFVPADTVANIKAPVLGLYGAEDPRIVNSIAPTEAKMKQLGKTYEPHIFEGAQHGFLRAQTAANGANMKATQQAWPLTVAWIKKYAS